MLRKLIPVNAIFALILLPFAANAAAGDPPADVPVQNLQSLVAALEDDTARARLVSDLKLMLAAHQPAKPEGAAKPDLLGELQLSLGETWQSILAVSPRKVAMASLFTVVIIGFALLLRWLVLRIARRMYHRISGDSAADLHGSEKPFGEHTAASPRAKLPALFSRLVSLFLGLFAAAMIAQSWGVEIIGLLRTNAGMRVADTVLSVGIILIMAVVSWHASRIAVTRALNFGARHLDEERTARRLNTLNPLLQRIAQVTITVLTLLVVLSELGVNIGPLLAGAGIVGLAVGFGAQTLVKDLITGVLILLEDGASVGDIIEVSGHSGQVEEMRIRSLQLRDVSGVVHLVPYSEVTTIKNFTQDYSYYVLNVGVAYREDTDQVCEALRAVDEDLRADPAFEADILQPLEILGVDQFADSAVVIKARIKTNPARQWACGREFNRRMKKRFDELNIEIPFPHTTVYFGQPRSGDAPAMQVAMSSGA